MDDHELLREYVAHHSERAFAELVERHLPLVYATALRLVHDPVAAEDIAQTVFIRLARKAWVVRLGALTGWLYHAAKCAAVDFLRCEGRRRRRETEAMKLAELENDAVLSWEHLAPLVDDALSHLNQVEQNAVLLRYFNGQSISETSRLLSLSEPAAQKRVSRALEKMRAYFARQGVTASAALLATTLRTHAATPPPAGLAGKITGSSLASATQVGGAGAFFFLLRIFFMSIKIKIALAVLALAIAIIFTATSLRWFTQPAPSAVIITSAPTVSKSSVAPRSLALAPSPIVPTAPTQSPPPLSPEATQPVSPPIPSDDPHADLKTALPDMARIVRTEGRQAMLHAYGPPDKIAEAMANPEFKQAMPRILADSRARANASPEMRQYNEALAQIFESLAKQAPTLNADGDEATYSYVQPQITLPYSQALPAKPQALIMVKIDGKWYVKSDIQNF